MVEKVIPFSAMADQGRWKVEFFCSSSIGSRCTAYPLVLLGELLRERRETLDPQQYPSHRFNYLGLEHVQSVTGDLVDGYRPRDGREVLSRSKVFRGGDILYGRLRPSLNKVFVADGTLPEGICSGEFFVLIPDEQRFLPHFARALLASRYVQDVVKGMTTGSALPRLNLGDLLRIELPLPPIEVQSRYQKELVAQRARRRELWAELIRGPSAVLDALVDALEEGTDPDFSRTLARPAVDFSELKLPGGVDTAARGRGRPAGRGSGASLFEPA